MKGSDYTVDPTCFIKTRMLTDDSQFAAAAERAKQRGFKYRELLSGGHDAIISQPAELAKLLVE